jgi:hypothetical protein
MHLVPGLDGDDVPKAGLSVQFATTVIAEHLRFW